MNATAELTIRSVAVDVGALVVGCPVVGDLVGREGDVLGLCVVGGVGLLDGDLVGLEVEGDLVGRDVEGLLLGLEVLGDTLGDPISTHRNLTHPMSSKTGLTTTANSLKLLAVESKVNSADAQV
jgi:hypothetical protein